LKESTSNAIFSTFLTKKRSGELKKNENYRAASWWITWEDLSWPNEDIADKFRYRADQASASGVNMAVIYGAHFRWDFMPLWMNLHDMIKFVADELHQRDILLFDHHSSVLTHRYSSQAEALAMRLRNRHHLPFAPSRDIADEWTYRGMKLNDWRMIDLVTGKPVFLERYTAEQFCMNNPYFRKAYQEYVQRLRTETGIDGLMSDDGIFYSGWTSCGCGHCRKKFMDKYGHEVPPVSDTGFWGNYQNEAFKDWIEMRFSTTREFLEGVQTVTGKDFPLMTCCSDSVGSHLPGYGMTYQEFIKPCNHIMLEMCGNTPALDGSWQGNFPAQMLHVGIGRENSAPCLGLGYGFSETAADFIWAFNKFLGSGTWFSSLKGRLGLRDSEMLSLKDDTELSGNGFNWEKNNPGLFDAETDADVAVFFSRWSRDFYGMTEKDYTADYSKTCFELLNNNITFDVVTAIPVFPEYKVLIISSAICLAAEEYTALNNYLTNGGIVIAGGPVGYYDRRANSVLKPWLEQFGIISKTVEPERIAAFPPWSRQAQAVPLCSGVYQQRNLASAEWIGISSGKGRLLWTPGRMQMDFKELAIAEYVRNFISESFIFPPADSGWQFRIFKKANKSFVHALADKLDVGCMEELEKKRINNSGNNLINSIDRNKTASSRISLELKKDFKKAQYHAPLTGIQKSLTAGNGKIEIDIDENTYYFLLEFE
jgi:hypothetical protein